MLALTEITGSVKLLVHLRMPSLDEGESFGVALVTGFEFLSHFDAGAEVQQAAVDLLSKAEDTGYAALEKSGSW